MNAEVGFGPWWRDASQLVAEGVEDEDVEQMSDRDEEKSLCVVCERKRKVRAEADH
jgi:hypothetical protein